MAGLEKPKILITRAEPAASRTADELSEAGFTPIKLPLFEVVDTGTEFNNEAGDACIFTSANAVEVLKLRDWRPDEKSSRAYCVGEQTAAAAQDLGFSEVISSQGTARDLAYVIVASESGLSRPLLYFAGETRAFDMSLALRQYSIDLQMVEIYRIENVYPSKDNLLRLLEKLSLGFVFLYSHNTAKHVCETLFDGDSSARPNFLSAVTISAKSAQAVLKYPWRQVYVSDEPSEQSMIRKLSEISLA